MRAGGHIEERRRASGEITYRLRVHVGAGEYYVESLPAGTTKQDAERQLRKLIVDRDNSQLAKGSARRISDLWASYSVTGLSRLSPYTRNGYRDVYRLHIEPGLGNVKVAALTVGQVEDFLAAVMQKGLSWNSVKNVRICLSAMFTFAARRDEGVTLPHVVQRAKMPGEEPMTKTEIPDPAIAATVLRDLIATDLELAAIERVCAITGCRIGEAAALRFDDLLRDSIRFDEAVRVERWQGVISVTIGPTKTRTRRTVTIDDTTAAILEAWIEERGKGEPRDLLFPGPDGGPNQPGRFSARWKRACAKHGLKTHQHLLRHLVGTLTTESLGLRVAQERLGHARVDTTQRYAHVRSSSGVAAAELLGKALA